MRNKWLIAIPIILLLIGVCGAIVLTGFFAFREMRGISFNLPFTQRFEYEAEREVTQQFEVNGPAKLIVDNRFGNVRVERGTDPVIHVLAVETAYGSSQAAAEAALDILQVTMEQTGDTVRVRVKVEPGPSRNHTIGQVAFTITVPEETSVEIDTNSGDITLTGIEGEANLTTRFGSVEISDVQGGPLTVNTGSGRIQASNIQTGSLDITLETDFGEVNLENAAGGQVLLKTRNGPVSVSQVDAGGLVDLYSEFGRIEYNLGSAASVKLKTRNGDITVANVEAGSSLTAASDFGTIRLTGVDAARYDLSSRNGAIHADGVQGPVKAHSDFGDVEVKDGENATLDLKSKNGAVRYEGSLGSGPHTITSDFGAIQLRLPADSAFDFDLSTNFGKISSEFEVKISGAPDEDHWVGQVNGGGASLTITTKNGNIMLETY